MARKRYEDEEAAFAADPYQEGEESEEIQGPTDQLPYRFTEQALNPRAAATTGQMGRTPTARSAFTGVRNPGGIRSDIMYKDTLPMRATTIASGKLSKYDKLAGYKDIVDPGSLRGREQISQLKGFEGGTQRTSLMDMKAIGESFGYSAEKVDQLMGVGRTSEATYTRQENTKIGENDKTGRARMEMQSRGEAMTLEERDQMIKEGKYSTSDFKEGSRVTSDQSAAYGKSGKLGNDEKFFLGLMNLSNRTSDFDKKTMGGDQKQLEFNLGSARQIDQVMRMGSMGNVKHGMHDDLCTQQRDVDRQLAHGGKRNKWSSRFHTFGKLAIMAGFGAVGGMALGPAMAAGMGIASGGVGAGMVAGGVGGFIGAGTGQMMANDLNVRNANAATAPPGQQALGIDPETGVAIMDPGGTAQPLPTSNVNPVDPSVAAVPAGVDGAPGSTSELDTKKVFLEGGDIAMNTEKQEMAKQNAIDRQESQSQSSAQKNASRIQKTRRELSRSQGGLFGTQLPDDPYYNPEEDFGGIQQGVF